MNAIKYGSMTLTVELVTPAVAARWLGQSNTDNRRLRKKISAQYAEDMRRGDWHRKPVAICFGEDGLLGNGQHTLSAIVESGCAHELLIARNVPASAIAVMDVGLKRTISDIGHFLGNQFGSRESAIAKIVAIGPGNSEPKSFAFLFEAYQRHQHAIDTLCAASPKAVGFSAAVMAVMVRAWYSQDEARILEFVEVMKSGIVQGPEDTAAIRLRDHCRSLKSAGGWSVSIDTYRRAQSALDAFLRRKPMSKLYGTERELFPLPEDKQ